MFIVMLSFGRNRQEAPRWMEAHKDWINAGFASGMFQLSGSLVPSSGGALIAQARSRTEVEEFVALDPFVLNGVVEAAIHELAPNRAAPVWAFLLEDAA